MRKIEFGSYLTVKRSERNWTMRDLAYMSGIDVGAISRTERDETKVTASTAIRLLNTLGVTPDVTMTELEIGEITTPRKDNGILMGGNAITVQDALLIKDSRVLDWLIDAMNLISGLRFDGTIIIANEFEQKLHGKSFQPYSSPPYPITFTAKSLLDIYCRGSVIREADVRMYASKLPSEIDVRTFDRLRFVPILETVCDAESPFAAHLIPMLWNMYLSQNALQKNTTLVQERYVECCVTAYRWIESFDDPALLEKTARSLQLSLV